MDLCNKTRSNGFELKQGRFRTDARNNFFTWEVVKHWNRSLKEVVDAPGNIQDGWGFG